MRRFLATIAAVLALLLPCAAGAEPVKLKLAFFSSDRSHLYRSGVQPFVDAVNRTGKGRVEIEVHLSGKLGHDLARQTQLIDDGVADIVYVVQPYEKDRFPDSTVVELPGLYRNAAEATWVFSRLAASGVIRDFAGYVTLGLFASEPESIHVRPPVSSLADLKGKRIRANNETEIAIFRKLGIDPVFLPITETPSAILAGKVDGAAVPPVPMIEFGIGRVAPYHYMLPTSSVPQSLLMSRSRLEGLPADVRAVIRDYAGAWAIDRYVQINESATAAVMDQLKADARRKVIIPSPADMAVAGTVFKSVVDEYVAAGAHHAVLVQAARDALATLRAVNEVRP